MKSRHSKGVLTLIAGVLIALTAGCATKAGDLYDYEMPIDRGTGGDNGSGSGSGSGAGDGGSSGE